MVENLTDKEGERVEREVGGGIRMGNTCKPMAVSFQCMTKFTTNKKKKLKKKIDIEDQIQKVKHVFQMSSEEQGEWRNTMK